MSRQVRMIVDDLEGYLGDVVQGVALEVHAELVEGTPVDLGWARANWVPGVGGPGASSSAGKGSVSSAQAAQAAGVARVAGYRLGQGAIHVTNNVPYIEVLNGGHSMQAPAGFVSMRIEAGLARARARFGR